MSRQELRQSPRGCSKQENPEENGQNGESLFSPRFKSVAAMAGWDEEAILIASLVVEDTPDRDSKHTKRFDLHFKTPTSTNSRRKRKAQRRSPVAIPLPVLNLDEDESPEKESEEKKKKETEPAPVRKEKKTGGDDAREQSSGASCSNTALPCMDKLREELSCAICLEICFEPSTTTCGHSFCKNCLRCAADKCGKRCPKCRQLISGRSCTINTVLWNTIQLLFPQEIEARKVAAASSTQETESPNPRGNYVRQSVRPVLSPSRTSRLRRRGTSSQFEDAALSLRFQREDLSRLASSNENVRSRRRRGTPSQDEDAALALRLQREEFMEAIGGTVEHSRSSLSLARANLRAMASRAISIRRRNQVL